MKFLKTIIPIITFTCILFSCKKESEKQWNIDIKTSTEKIEIIDISKDFYLEKISLEDFQAQYPWFQGSVSNEDFAKRREEKEEIDIYQQAIKKINIPTLQKELGGLFSRIKHYFPEFQTPKVYIYSSALQSITDPIFYKSKENLLFIDISAFMGDGNPYYKGLELYYQKSMNPENILPKVSLVLAEHFVPYSMEHQKFIDQLVYQGKLMTLQDAFIPNIPNHLKINYTDEQYQWCITHQENIWNYFVENDLLFSDDARLIERFIAPAPFSKFYTEIDNESTPQVGIYVGWQICKAFYKENATTSLKDFLNTNAETIFNQSKYDAKQ